MFGIGTFELVIVGIVAVMLFGSRLPSVARSLGKSLTEFKKGMREFESEVHNSVHSEPAGRMTYHDQVEHATPSAATNELEAVAAAGQPANAPRD